MGMVRAAPTYTGRAERVMRRRNYPFADDMHKLEVADELHGRARRAA
jgi:hypothetical protein